MKTLVKLFLAFTVIFGGFDAANAQSPKKERQAAKAAAVKKMIDEGNYVFKANYAYPQRGGQKILDYYYDLRVSKDSVIAFLPYYGEAHQAPNPGETEGGIKFTSTNFKYSTKQRKNGTWDIFIKPKDNNIIDWRDVQQLELSVSSDGNASLQVISSNRDPISFNGEIVGKTNM